jgi:hypothetical protein
LTEGGRRRRRVGVGGEASLSLLERKLDCVDVEERFEK